MPAKGRILISSLLTKEFIVSRWDIFSAGVIVLFLLLQSVRFSSFPLFIDIYYHLSVMLGFNQAGGYTSWAFWEAAPLGRPHLYPPLLHIIMLFLYKAGLSKIAVAKLFDFGLYPAALFFIWLVFRKFFSRSFAFWAVLAAGSVYTFYLSFVNTHAASLALLICIGVFYCIEARKILAAALLFGLSFYAHLGIAIVFAVVFTLYALFRRGIFRHILALIIGGIVIAAPLLAHFFRFRSYFQFYNPTENQIVELNIFLYAFAACGAVISFKKKGRYCIFLALFLGMLPLIFGYRFRFFCFQGLIGAVLLCAVFLDELCRRIKDRRKNGIFIFTVFILLFIFSPVLRFERGNAGFNLFGSNFIRLARQCTGPENMLDVRNAGIYQKKFFGEITDLIAANSRSDEIIWADMDYACGILGLLTGRATSTAMLNEVRIQAVDPIAAAKVIILFRQEDGALNPKREALAAKYKLTHLADTELASLYLNSYCQAKRLIPKPLVTTPFLLGIFFFYLVLIAVFLVLS